MLPPLRGWTSRVAGFPPMNIPAWGPWMVISRYRAKINSRLCGKIVSSLPYQPFVSLGVVNQIIAQLLSP